MLSLSVRFGEHSRLTAPGTLQTLILHHTLAQVTRDAINISNRNLSAKSLINIERYCLQLSQRDTLARNLLVQIHPNPAPDFM